MTVAELYLELAEADPDAEIFVQIERDRETVATAIADVLHVTNIDGAAVVLRLAEE